jgi:hypothetical protein
MLLKDICGIVSNKNNNRWKKRNYILLSIHKREIYYNKDIDDTLLYHIIVFKNNNDLNLIIYLCLRDIIYNQFDKLYNDFSLKYITKDKLLSIKIA